MDADARAALAERVLRHARADATEAIVTSERRALTRFTHGTIHQNVDVDDVEIRVRAVIGERTGVAVTNRTDDDAIAAAVERATAIATFAPRDATAPPVVPIASTLAPPGAYVAATADASAEERSRIAAAMFGRAEAGGAWSSGYVMTSAGGVTLATSAGGHASFDGTDAAANVKVTTADSTGFAERYSGDARELDGAALGERAAGKARASALPVAVEPGDLTVILEPPAFGELLAFLAAHFSAQSVDEGSSFLTDRLGEAVMGSNVTIRDDSAHPLHPGMPFDWEGTPKVSLPLIEGGVARNVVTDRRWAAKLGRANTGHALPAPNGHGPMPWNLVVDPGTDSLDALIAGTARGLLVTRLWYTRSVDQRKTILTGMTRDGTFLIENGTVGPGVHNLRFNQSLVDALTTCVLGDTPVRTGGYSYGCVVPPIRFERFTFASATDY